MAKASHIALPAACATTPRIEKIPAPTIPPIPIETAAAMPICPDPRLAAGAAGENLAGLGLMYRTRESSSLISVTRGLRRRGGGIPLASQCNTYDRLLGTIGARIARATRICPLWRTLCYIAPGRV